MAHIKQTKYVKYIKPIPCAICNSVDNIHEYMLSNGYSFFSCDTCNVSAEAGKTAEEAVNNWDSIMHINKLTKEQYENALDSDYLGGHYDRL